jgi:hypothetical protein
MRKACLCAFMNILCVLAGCGSGSDSADAGADVGGPQDSASVGDARWQDDGPEGGDSEAGCPAFEPAVGSACSGTGTCVYGASICCGGGFACTGGSWQLVYAACACRAPAADAATDGRSDAAAADAQPSPQADGAAGCNLGSDCGAGQICVHFNCAFGGDSSRCVANPCGASPMDCSCAQPACGQYGCSASSAQEGWIDCLQCGG